MATRADPLTAKLFGIVASALGALVMLIGGILINRMVEISQDVAEIKAAVPHIQERVARMERRLDERYRGVDRRLQILESYHRGGFNGDRPLP